MLAHEYILEELAAATMSTTADDLQGLARLHSLLTDFSHALPKAEAISEAAGGMSAQASSLVEQMILNEVADADAALKQLGEMAAGIMDLVKGKSPSTSAATPVVAAPVLSSVATAPVEAKPAAPVDEVDPKDRALVVEFINEANEHVSTAEASLLTLEKDPGDHEAINAMFRAFHTIKGVAGFIKLNQIGKLAHAAENLMDLARSGTLKLDTIHIDALLKSVDLVKVMTAALENAINTGTPPPVQPDMPALVDQLHQLTDPSHHDADAVKRGSPVRTAETPTVQAINDKAGPEKSIEKLVSAPKEKSAEKAAETKAAPSAAESVVKVSTDRLDSLINAIGELVIAQSMINQDVASIVPPSHRVVRSLTQVGKIARELQDLSMSMRMVPIAGVFQKMSRLARDLTRKSGKEFELELVGGETELDRGLVDAISDPLVHMVRNSADHGIEPPEDRVKAGKSRCGKITLKAYHQAGNIVVEIKDDGRGLNKARILKKAIERGIVPAGKELSEQEIFKLIFAAGLSTAEKVTDVSGRGVGMDVVLRNVESLRGRVDIESAEGVGSTFTIRLPLTLAVIDGLVVKVGAERYIVPITSIEQSLRPKPEQITTVTNQGELCMVRDSLVPIVRMHRLFGVQGAKETITEGLLVIVQNGLQRVGLLVDDLLGQQQCVIKSLGDALGPIKGVSGGAILGDGNIRLILDVQGLIASAVN